MPEESSEKSTDELKQLAYHFRARGHSLRWIAKRCNVSHMTIMRWCDTAPCDELLQIQEEAQPEIEDDVRLAREELRGQIDDPELPPWERRSASGILLTNHTRMVEALARKLDAETNKRKTGDEVKAMERKAKERLLGQSSDD